MATIGDRIKLKRKELGLTQAELGKKLNVTDRAVSKWEQNEGNPDMSIIASLANVLGVSLDYLILGKEDEIISIDDMDTEKRALYLAKKDDIESFVKYKYDDVYILFDSEIRRFIFNRDTNAKFHENLRNAIIENKSYKIFSALLDKFVEYCKDRRNENLIRDVFSGASFVKSYLNEFVTMACALERIDVLELIKFKWFRIGSCSQPTDKFTPFVVSEATLETVLEKPVVADYLANVEFLLLLRRDEMFGRMTQIPIAGSQVNVILNYFYKRNDKSSIDVVLNRLYTNLRENTKGYQNYNVSDDIRNGYRDVKKVYSNGICYSFKRADSYEYYSYYCAVPVISTALTSAQADLNVDMIVTFNSYNKEVATTLNEKIHVLNDEDIRLFKIKGNPNASKDEKVVASHSRYGICSYKSLMNLAQFEGFDSNNADCWKKIIPLFKSVYADYVKDAYISYMEMFEDCIERKDYKTLFKFATDYKLSSLEEPIIDCDNKEILAKARELFTPNEAIVSEISVLEEKEKNLLGQRYRENEVKNVKETKTKKVNSLYGNDELIADMLKWQYSIISYKQMVGVSSFKELSKSLKKEYLDSLIENAEEKIENITQEKKRKEDYERVANEITFDYLRKELSKNNIDTVIIKLCVRLEATLKYKYRYEGDLFDMVDTYVKNHFIIHELHNCWDDEDNNYYAYQKEDEEFKIENKNTELKTQVLHKLRMKRNSIVHAENSKVEMSKEDIEMCISIVETM